MVKGLPGMSSGPQRIVRMLPPSGNPVADLSFKKARATVYNVSYTAQEKGDHALTIRWGPDDIPGSPFTIPVS